MHQDEEADSEEARRRVAVGCERRGGVAQRVGDRENAVRGRPRTSLGDGVVKQVGSRLEWAQLLRRVYLVDASMTMITIPREGTDRTSLQVFDLFREKHRSASRAYHNSGVRGGARRAHHMAPSRSGGACLRLTKVAPPRWRRRRAEDARADGGAAVRHVDAFAQGRAAPGKGARVGARGNGGEARAPGDPSTTSRAMSARSSSNRERRSPRSPRKTSVHRIEGGSLCLTAASCSR